MQCNLGSLESSLRLSFITQWFPCGSFFFKLKCNRHSTVSVSYVRHSDSIFYIHFKMVTLLTSYHLSPHKVITILLTIFPVLRITSPWLYFITGSLYLLIPFTDSAWTQPANPFPLWQPPVCFLYLWDCFCFVF